jgi:TM2 domain-containing membrane protein YozV
MATSHKSKPAAGLLAALAGSIGAHRLYLDWKWWWIYAAVSIPCMVWAFQAREWFKQPAFFIGTIPIVAGLLEAIILSLMPDEKWDEKYNAQSGKTSANRWAPVLIAIGSLLAGATLLMTTLVLLFQTYFEAQLGVS